MITIVKAIYGSHYIVIVELNGQKDYYVYATRHEALELIGRILA